MAFRRVVDWGKRTVKIVASTRFDVATWVRYCGAASLSGTAVHALEQALTLT